jgi:hypothetical protein
MKTLLFACLTALAASPAFAQAPEAMAAPLAQRRNAPTGASGLATPTGSELSAGVADYTYREPGGDTPISIQGVKFTAGFTSTFAVSRRQHWFATVDVRGVGGNVTYNGYCSPFLISPNSASPNGYELDIGNPSACSESGDRDWYVETRGLAGKDFIGRTVAVSPYSGLGLRYLSNGTTGTPGYRTDRYLYLPVGVTARTKVASTRALSVTLEYDRLLHGWQNTHDSDLGSGTVPATSTAPAFTINGFSDISFSQSGGWAIRASANCEITRHWSLEPYFVRWSVNSSPVNYETVSFTVNGIAAKEQLGAYEPFNTTQEFGLKLGLKF